MHGPEALLQIILVLFVVDSLGLLVVSAQSFFLLLDIDYRHNVDVAGLAALHRHAILQRRCEVVARRFITELQGRLNLLQLSA